MSLTFSSPIGAVADVKELEYISALHQTCSSTDESFVDGSIDAADIKYYLMSRHGIDVSKEHVRKVILSGLGGGDSEDDCLDIAELVAILIIPALLSVIEGDHNFHDVKLRTDFLTNRGYNNHVKDMESLSELQPSPTLIADVLKIILINVTGTSEPPLLTKELITSIFAAYDEIELLQNDDLIEEMIQIASGGKPDARLDKEAFERALTEDVQQCDSKSLLYLSTYFEDAFGSNVDAIFPPVTKSSKTQASMDNGDDDEAGYQQSVKDDESPPRLVSTFPSADFTAETFRGRGHAIALFFAVPLAYMNFFYLSETQDTVDVCTNDGFGCEILLTIMRWVILMLLLAFLGSAYLAGLSLGNHKSASLLENVAGIIFTALTVIVPNFVRFDFHFFSNIQSDDVLNRIVRFLNVAVGVFIILNQVCNICKRFIPESKLQESQILGLMFKGSEARSEQMMKQAAAFKVNNMIKNAYKLHFDYTDPTKSQVLLKNYRQGSVTIETEVSTHAKALLNYTNGKDDKEQIGGFIWVWKEFISGDLLDRHGIWIHSRLLAANILQFITLILVVLVLGLASSGFLNDLYPPETQNPDVDYEGCVALWNSTLCDYPSIPLGDGGKVGVASCFNVLVYPLKPGACDSFFIPVPEEYQSRLDTMCGYLADGVEALLAEAQESNTPAFASELTTLGLDSLDLRDQCPDLYYSNYYAIETRSDDSTYCAAAVTACAIVYESEDEGTIAHCVLGFDNNEQLPGMFSGELCNEIPDVAAMVSVEDFLPLKWMIDLSFGVGFAVIILSITALVVIVIPSTVTTVLKFRTGCLETLHNPNFNTYRSQMEDMSFLLGIMFWGLIFSAILLFGFSAGVVFLLVWQVTRPYVIQLISVLIGICVTLICRVILIKALGKFNYAGFYRKRPLAGNIATLALECWHIALTVGFMAARVIKIMLCAAFYVGRVDTPVLAEGGIGDTLDRFPHVYRKELLSTEAHRHPYIESLGFMYLLKLRHGEDFGKLSGSIWRLLFVFALMPWLRKYRIQTSDEDAMQEILLEKLQLKVQPGVGVATGKGVET